jgi:hypothetical protein
MIIDFKHELSAHCESGASSNLLRHYNIPVTEPLVFGIGSGMYFGHLPFLKMNYKPVTTFRALPGLVFSRVCKHLGVEYERKTFRSPEKAMDELDRVLDKGIPVGLQVGVYHLPFFPPEYRMHYNMHNMVIFGKEGNTYYVADSVIEGNCEISYDDLKRVRFPKGAFAPKGRMYYITHVPENIDFRKPIVKGIKKSVHEMIEVPFPLIGVKGIRFLSRRMRKWPQKLGNKLASDNLGQLILMLEEIGTGGAGYRFIYGAFLKEAAQILEQDWLNEVSKEMGEAANRWREFSYLGARNCKNRAAEPEQSYDLLADIILDCAEKEEAIFRKLKKIKL